LKSKGLFGHDIIEIFSGNFSSVGGGSLEHFLQLSDTHSLAQLLGNSLDIVYIDESSLIIIKKVENLVDTILYRTNKLLLIIYRLIWQ
jgi:hypothetical protein